MAPIYNSEDGATLRRIRGARAAHERIRASGRVPGEEARAQLAQLRRQAQEENGAAGMDYSNDILAGIDE